MLQLLATLLLPALTHGTPLSTNHIVERQQTPLVLAPVLEYPGAVHLNDSYIIALREGLGSDELATHFSFLQLAHQASAKGEDPSFGVRHVYDTGLTGYAGSFSEDVIERIRGQPEVMYVERDQVVWASKIDEENGAPWGLARISHRKKLTFGTFRKYIYEHKGGEGVDAYVIDTGIHVSHEEFEGRAIWGTTIPTNDVDDDGNGHGTHCAGTIASKKYGVAKGANLIAVKVLGSNGSGSMTDVVAGVDWASKSAKAKAKAAEAELARTGKTKYKGSVANMSLGGGKSRTLDAAVNAAVTSGLHFAVAAGNDNKDACNYSPAAAEKAITVGASTLQDSRAYFSNYGKCVDVFAPGLNILSTWTGSNSSTNTISGTSMASPHVAGLLAYLLSIYPSTTFDPPVANTRTSQLSSFVASFARSTLPSFLSGLLLHTSEALAPIPPHTITTDELKKALIGLATEGALSDLDKDTVNKLVFNNATSA